MNLAWAKEWVGNWNAKGADKVVDSYAEDAIFHDMPTGHRLVGKPAIAKMWLGSRENPNPGVHTFEVTGYCGNADAGTVERTWAIKHASDFLGLPAKGKETFVAGVSVLYFKNGKIKEQHEYWDMGAIMRQLGVVK